MALPTARSAIRHLSPMDRLEIARRAVSHQGRPHTHTPQPEETSFGVALTPRTPRRRSGLAPSDAALPGIGRAKSLGTAGFRPLGVGGAGLRGASDRHALARPRRSPGAAAPRCAWAGPPRSWAPAAAGRRCRNWPRLRSASTCGCVGGWVCPGRELTQDHGAGGSVDPAQQAGPMLPTLLSLLVNLATGLVLSRRLPATPGPCGRRWWRSRWRRVGSGRGAPHRAGRAVGVEWAGCGCWSGQGGCLLTWRRCRS